MQDQMASYDYWAVGQIPGAVRAEGCWIQVFTPQTWKFKAVAWDDLHCANVL